MKVTDLSLGFDPAREQMMREPTGDYRFAENLMFAITDPDLGISMWLHLGTWPDDFALWEDYIQLHIHGGDTLISRSYLRQPWEQRPAGANLRAQCIEPWKKWRLTYDGIGMRASPEDLRTGAAPDSPREQLQFDLELTMAGPVWDAHASASSKHGGGSMAEQVWAKDHYQQLYTVAGTITIGGETKPFHATGVRDHSRGQRGAGNMDQFEGHALISALYPSGKGFGIQRMWNPQGKITLDTAFVYIDGHYEFASVVECPRLGRELQYSGEKLLLVLRSDLGEHRLEGEVVCSGFTPAGGGMGLGFGAWPNSPGGYFAQGFSRWTWDGETAYGLTERIARDMANPPAWTR